MVGVWVKEIVIGNEFEYFSITTLEKDVPRGCFVKFCGYEKNAFNKVSLKIVYVSKI